MSSQSLTHMAVWEAKSVKENLFQKYSLSPGLTPASSSLIFKENLFTLRVQVSPEGSERVEDTSMNR